MLFDLHLILVVVPVEEILTVVFLVPPPVELVIFTGLIFTAAVVLSIVLLSLLLLPENMGGAETLRFLPLLVVAAIDIDPAAELNNVLSPDKYGLFPFLLRLFLLLDIKV